MSIQNNFNSKSILFFGELPPKTIHGVSLSNDLNINILREFFEVQCIEEYSTLSQHNIFSLNKTRIFLKSLFKYYINLFKKNSYCFFYGVLYISRFGIIKNILLTFPIKIFSNRITIILHIHRSDLNLFLKSRVNKFLFYLLDFFVDKYIFLAKSHQESLISTIAANKQNVLYNCINETGLVERTISYNQTSLKILFISNYLEKKGIFDLFNAARSRNFIKKDITINCFGNFTSDFDLSDALLLRNQKFEVSLNVSGPIFSQDKINAINDTDLIILPSHNEGFPLVLIEALYFGKPIIITKVGFVNEILGDDYPLYIETNKPESIVNAINKFINSVDSRFDWGKYLREKYDVLSFQNHKKNLLDIFGA